VRRGFPSRALHHHVVDAILFADVVEDADMRMVKARDGPGFGLEALAEVLALFVGP